MAVLVDGELVLYGFVGDSFWGEGFTAREVLDALAEVGRDADIAVRINSGGGYIDDGIAIYNALSAHKGKVTVIVDAMAASSASVIAMAGAERVMRKGAMLMIHDPSGGGWGTARDMERQARVLDKYAASMAGIYADATGESAEDVRADMEAETWLTADEAVARGFATAVNDSKAKAVAAHDYRVYARAPDRLVAMAKRRDWTHPENHPPATASAAAQPRQQKESTMTTEKPADSTPVSAAAVANDVKARIKAITTSGDAQGREALAQHLAFETELPADAAIAALKAAPKAGQGAIQEAPQAAGTEAAAQAYEQRRLAAAGLAQPDAGRADNKAAGDAILAAALARVNGRRR